MSMQTDKESAKHILGRHGWKMGEFNHTALANTHVIYIRDFRTKHSQLFTVSKNDFDNSVIAEDLPVDECINFVGQVMKKISKGKSLIKEESITIVPVLVHYIKKTRCYKQWCELSGLGESLHMLINIYYDAVEDEKALRFRPFIVKPESEMLTAKQFMDCTAMVHADDRRRHPEWFR
ncbi:hypothetical protein ACI0X9_003268 [Cronobacter turicensis]